MSLVISGLIIKRKPGFIDSSFGRDLGYNSDSSMRSDLLSFWEENAHRSLGPYKGPLRRIFHTPIMTFRFGVFFNPPPLTNCTALWVRSSKPASSPRWPSSQQLAQ